MNELHNPEPEYIPAAQLGRQHGFNYPQEEIETPQEISAFTLLETDKGFFNGTNNDDENQTQEDRPPFEGEGGHFGGAGASSSWEAAAPDEGVGRDGIDDPAPASECGQSDSDSGSDYSSSSEANDSQCSSSDSGSDYSAPDSTE